MDWLEKLEKWGPWLAGEQEVILSAPWTMGFSLLLAIAITIKVMKLLYGRDLDSQRTTIEGLITTHGAAMQLEEKRHEILRDENAALQKELEKKNAIAGPAAAIPVNFGNTAVQSAAAEIKRDGSVTFYGNPDQWTQEQIGKFAAYSHLREHDLVTIVNSNAPTTSTVTGTATLSAIAQWIKPPKSQS